MIHCSKPARFEPYNNDMEGSSEGEVKDGRMVGRTANILTTVLESSLAWFEVF